MIDVFLSAGVPLPTRDRQFFDTADVSAIREAVKALVEVVLPIGRITCGGHPAITPLLAIFVKDAGLPATSVTVFQSALYISRAPKELYDFIDVRIIPAVPGDDAASMTAMRREMISSRAFDAAVFVGGMDGLFEELSLFTCMHPHAKVLPIASTGAAAAQIYANGQFDPELANNLTFPTLFRRRLAPSVP